jgi:uncharacterized protein (TIGR00369 family)
MRPWEGDMPEDRSEAVVPPALQGADFGVLPLSRIAHLTGLEALQSMIAGDLPAPPMSKAALVYLAEAIEGRVVFEGMPAANFLNPLGTIHGGWTALIMDSAMACAVHSTLRKGEAYTTLEFKLHYCRPILPDTGLVRAEGVVLSRGRRAATSEGKLFDSKGRLLAHGTETCMIFDAPGASAA